MYIRNNSVKAYWKSKAPPYCGKEENFSNFNVNKVFFREIRFFGDKYHVSENIRLRSHRRKSDVLAGN